MQVFAEEELHGQPSLVMAHRQGALVHSSQNALGAPVAGDCWGKLSIWATPD